MSEAEQQQQKIPLEEVPIDSFPVALSLLYQYLNLANRRGAFSLDQSGKVIDCLNYIRQVVRPVQRKDPVPAAPQPAADKKATAKEKTAAPRKKN